MYTNSILPADVAVVLGLMWNIIASLAAFWATGKYPRMRSVFHGLACFVILLSPLTAMILGLPGLLPEEEESPGARFVFLPLIFEAAIVLLLYCLAGAMLLQNRFIRRWRTGAVAINPVKPPRKSSRASSSPVAWSRHRGKGLG